MKRQAVILYRKCSSPAEDEREMAAAREFFPVVTNRAAVPPGSLVIGRYSVLPFYRELVADLATHGSVLLNSYADHIFIASLIDWYTALGPELTPRTWDRIENLPERGPFVLKGETNSRKDRWSTHMFAETRRDAGEVACRLREDGLLSTQTIYARQYIPLKRLTTGLGGLPVSDEYRFFCLDGRILSSAFYWSSHVDDLGGAPAVPEAATRFVADSILPRLEGMTRFVVVDVAQDENGRWWCVELNDGQQSGLSENDPTFLYRALYEALSRGGE